MKSSVAGNGDLFTNDSEKQKPRLSTRLDHRNVDD
jgi:hypothetical protein